MKFKKLDELQLIKRGNIFKHCLFTTILLLLVYVFTLESDIVIASTRNSLLLIIFFVVSMFCIEMIGHDIYPLFEKRQRILYVIAGLIGVACIIASVHEMIRDDVGFFEEQMLSDYGVGIIMGSLLFIILPVYIIKNLLNRRDEI